MSLSNFYICYLAYSTVSRSFGGFSTTAPAFSEDGTAAGVYSAVVEVSEDSDSDDGVASAAAAAPPLYDS